MLETEARRIRDILSGLPLAKGCVVVDIGSSTEEFRCLSQPYIDYHVFRPLRKRGAMVVHVDAKADNGVDVVFDITAAGHGGAIDGIPKGDVVLCTGLLEHVSDREVVVKRLEKMVKDGGWLIVSAPLICEYHLDPIDTMFRPTASELKSLFADDSCETLYAEMLESDNRRVSIMDARKVRGRRFLNKILRFVLGKRLYTNLVTKPASVALIVLRKNVKK